MAFPSFPPNKGALLKSPPIEASWEIHKQFGSTEPQHAPKGAGHWNEHYSRFIFLLSSMNTPYIAEIVLAQPSAWWQTWVKKSNKMKAMLSTWLHSPSVYSKVTFQQVSEGKRKKGTVRGCPDDDFCMQLNALRGVLQPVCCSLNRSKTSWGSSSKDTEPLFTHSVLKYTSFHQLLTDNKLT